MRGKELKKDWMKLPAECFNTLIFADLKPGDRFITLPEPGDNKGHGGFKDAHHIYQKLRVSGNEIMNAGRLLDGYLAQLSDWMPVLKVE